ncbi:hypothetical protein PFISCL1PPCAC_22496, partial [Pristionchus fissidentatus]
MRVERAAFNPDSSLGRSRESMATSTSGVFEEEKVGVIRSGTLQGGFTPLKGRGKSYYVVLSPRALEMYENQKEYAKKKPSKYTIDLAVAFNVHNEHYDTRLGKCVCVMRPNDTLLLRAENDQANQEWYDAILGTTCPARALRLGRLVQPMEFFECAYDVQIVETPRKLGHKKGEEVPPANLIDKYPHVIGARRLCFYSHTIFLCEMGVEPGKEDDIPLSGIPPFKPIHFFEIQRKFIPNFGYRDNYFILMMGRGSPMGSCELWAECESKQIAEHIHHALNGIIDREAEKKKRMGNGLPQLGPAMPTSAISSHRGHRERSHTQPHRKRLDSEILARNTNSPLAHLARKSSTGTMACTAGSHRTPPTTLPDPSASSLPVPGSRHSFAAPGAVKGLVVHSSIFPVRRQSETIKEEAATTYQAMDATDEAKKRWDELMRGETQGRAVSPSTTRSSTDETEDSGGTLKCFDETEDSGGTLKLGGESKPQTPNGSIRNLSMMATHPRQFVPISNKADHLSSSEDDADVISAGTNTSTGGESISAGEVDYTHMDVVNWEGEGSLGVHLYKLDTPRSFVSSSDSCYSSMAERQQLQREQPTQQQMLLLQQDAGPQPQFRTYSFGPSHPSYQRPSDAAAQPQDPGIHSSNDGVEAGGEASNIKVEAPVSAKDDPRKRAFSLGSKNFFAYCSRPFRKISQHSTRATRHSNTSTSGASLASSTVSSGPPPSSVSSNHIANLGGGGIGGGPMMSDKDDLYNRNRSGSFGSGRSTPYSRRSGPLDKIERDHLMELDFGGGPSSSHHGLGGRCGSGSMGSVESPSRSRTSSFGCNVKKDDRADDAEAGMTPSQLLLHKAKQLSVDDAPAVHDDSDYVETEAASVPLLTSPRMTSASSSMNGSNHHGGHHHHHHHHQQKQQHHSPDHAPTVQQGYPGGVLDVMGKSHDARSSQYFETIEETTSGRSSRASSIDDDDYTDTTGVDAARDDDDSEYTLMELGVPAAAAA